VRVQGNLLFILVTVFLDTIGIGLLVPIFPKIIQRFATDTQTVSEYFGLFVASYAMMQFLAAPVLGALSDRFGRKIVLLGSLLGAAIDYLFMAFAPSIQLLLLGRLIAGLTGASMTVASSYIADVSIEDERAKNFGLIGAAWGLGFIAGPTLGSLLDWFGPWTPFIFASLLNLANFIFGLVVLPESLPPEKRRALNFKKLNPLRSVLHILRPSKIAVFVWIYFLIFLAGQAFPVNWTLFTQLKFNWTPLELGFSLSFIGIIVALSQGFLTRYLIPKIGETKSVSLAILFYGICFLLFSIVNQSWMIYLVIPLFSLTGVATPSLQVLIARQTPNNEQGELQGSLVALGSLASVIAPLVFTPIFVYFTKAETSYYFPGVIFFLAAGISFFTLALWSYYLDSAEKVPNSRR
jgi:DHA1 family tetracycline resistance protein-like MFS transporter